MTKAESITAYIQEEIRAGRWQPGDQLPTVSELQARFDASSANVSEAMRPLKARGIVRSVRGTNGGYFLTDRGAQAEDPEAELREARQAIEAAYAEAEAALAQARKASYLGLAMIDAINERRAAQALGED